MYNCTCLPLLVHVHVHVYYCYFDNSTRRSSKPRQHHSSHSGQPTSHTSYPPVANPPSTSDPSLVHVPTSEPIPVTPDPITLATSAAPLSADVTTSSSSAPAAPQLSDVIRTPSSDVNTGGGDQSEAGSPSSTRAQTGSPIQLDHSYALTFSSTAEEIPLLNDREAGYSETPPQTTPTTASQSSSVPASVIRNTPPRFQTSVPHPHHHGSRHALINSSSNSTTSRASLLRRSIGSNENTSSQLETGGDVVPTEVRVDRDSNGRTTLPPHMLSSVEPSTVYGMNVQHVHPPLLGGMNIFVPTRHAQNNILNTTTTANEERGSNWNTSSPPVPGTFEVPDPVMFTQYPSRSDIHVRTTVNSSRVGWAERERLRLQSLISSRLHDRAGAGHERERQRLENSTAFIASLSHERESSDQRRGRRRNRNNAQTEPAEGASSTVASHVQRDRSPNGSHAFSTSSSRSRRRRVRHTPHAVDQVHVPLPTMRVPFGLPDTSASHTPSYQVVPQSSLLNSGGVGITRSHSSLPHLPPLPWLPSSHSQISVPATSSTAVQLPVTPRENGNSSEPVVQLVQPELLMSHSGSLFHTPTSSQPTTTAAVEPASRSDASLQQLPVFEYVPQQSSEDTTRSREDPGVERDDHRVPLSAGPSSVGGGRGQRDSDVPASRSQSHVEVIIVDSSDSEVRYNVHAYYGDFILWVIHVLKKGYVYVDLYTLLTRPHTCT